MFLQRGIVGSCSLSLQHYVVNPAVLDACFHATASVALTAYTDRNSYYLPESLGRVHLQDLRFGSAKELYSYAKLTRWQPGEYIPCLLDA